MDEVREYARELLGKILVTEQTGSEGKEVKRLLIEEGSNIEKEYYIGLVLDSATDRVTLMGSEEGGVDIEAVAAATPEKIFKEVIDPLVGLTGFQARRLSYKIGIPTQLVNKATKFMLGLYQSICEKISIVEITH